ncbi:MAG: hypothetical protein MK100_07490 [Phycisphaerales bacterium]|nr:hypothetical protein [Phycisphaerales bacterium]
MATLMTLSRPMFKVFWCFVAVVAIVSGIIVLAILRPSTLRFIVESQLEAVIGGEVEIESIEWGVNSQLEVLGVSVRAPGLPDAVSEILFIDEMTLQWTGGPLSLQVTDIVVHEATLRLIEEHTWALTIGRMHPEVASSGGASGGVSRQGGPQLPGAVFESVVLESGTLRDGTVELAGVGVFTGKLEPLEGGALAAFELSERDGTAVLSGTIDLDEGSVSAKAEGVSLGSDSQRLVPFEPIRTAAEQLGLDGKVVEIKFDYKRGVQPTAWMVLEGVSIQLDPTLLGIGSSDFWKIYLDGRVLPERVPPRLFVESGLVEFKDDKFLIQGLDGFIEAHDDWGDAIRIPYGVELSVDVPSDLSNMVDLASMQAALSRAPFMLDCSAWDIEFEEGRRAVVPADAARILSMFRVRQCETDMRLVFMRDEPGGDVIISGEMDIAGGQGAYEKFPYELHDLYAHIEYTREGIVVESLVADGSGDGKVSITGWVEPKLGRELEVNVRGTNVPIDAVLLDALPPRAERTLREVFSEENIDAKADASGNHQIVQLDLVVEQDAMERLAIGGNIDFDALQMTWAPFPVSLDLEAGRLRWDDAIHIESLDGGPVRMRAQEGGGHGTISGAIEVPLGDGPAGGWIEVTMDGQEVTEELRRALLVVSDGDTAAISSGGLTGRLAVVARIDIDDEEVDYLVEATVREGQLGMSPALEELIGIDPSGGFGGADSLELDGNVVISSTRGVECSPLSVRAGGVNCQLEGGGTRAPLIVAAEDVHVGPWLLQFSDLDWLDDWWQRRDPSGLFNMRAVVEGDPMVLSSTEISEFSAHLKSAGHALLRSGRIQFVDGGIACHAAEVDIEQGDMPSFAIELQGKMRGANDGDMEITAGQLELGAGVVRDVVGIFGGEEADKIWQDLSPTGEISLSATWNRRRTADWWELAILPRDIEATWGGYRLPFKDTGGSAITVMPADVRVDRLAGDVGNASIDVGGAVAFDAGETTMDIEGRYAGGLRDPLLLALAGSTWRDVIDAIELEDGGRTQISPLRVVLSEREDVWTGRITGQVETDRAALTTGVRIEDVDARVEAILDLEEEGVSIDLNVARAKARVKEAHVQSLSGPIRSAPSPEAPDQVRIGPLAGEMGGGRLVVDAQAGGESGAWTASVELKRALLQNLFPGDKEGDEPASTGRVDAALHLRGMAGSTASTMGVGDFRVTEGHLRTLPALVAIQQVLHLSSPVVGAIAFVDVDFLIQGTTANLDRILLAAGPWGGGGFSLEGSGELDLKTFAVDARMRPRGAWPILSDVIGAIQDQFYQVSMTGHVGDPKVDLVLFPGTASARQRN